MIPGHPETGPLHLNIFSYNGIQLWKPCIMFGEICWMYVNFLYILVQIEKGSEVFVSLDSIFPFLSSLKKHVGAYLLSQH